MANPIDKGTQKIRTKYLQDLDARLENQSFYKIAKKGIYEGGTLSLNGTDVDVTALICMIEDSTQETISRIETTVTYSVSGVVEATPYIVLEFEWVDSENNYMDFVPKDLGSINSTDIVLGKATFVGGVIQATFDLTARETVDDQGLVRVGGTATITGDVDITGDLSITGGITENGVTLKRKKLPIGNWNMDLSPVVQVTHGVDYEKIILISGYVRNDNNTIRYPIPTAFSTGNDLYINYYNPSIIELGRTPSGLYDSANFDSSPYNRGDLIIIYED